MKLSFPSKCQDCMFFKRGEYQDMAATIPYVNCELGLFKEDGRDLASKHNTYNNGKVESPIIVNNCPLQNKYRKLFQKEESQ